MRRRKDGLCHMCMNPGTTIDGYCDAHAPDGSVPAGDGEQVADPFEPANQHAQDGYVPEV